MVRPEVAVEWAESNNLSHVETSAKTNDGVDELFTRFSREITRNLAGER